MFEHEMDWLINNNQNWNNWVEKYKTTVSKRVILLKKSLYIN